MRITKHIKALKGYVYGEQPTGKGVIKINTNENAYPPSPNCIKAISESLVNGLKIYPNAECLGLRKELAKLHKTEIENIFVGNGSDEILSLCTKAFVEDDECIGSLDPSYSLYPTLADIRNVKWCGADVNNFPALKKNVSLFIWTNPNAPTGSFVKPSQIAQFAKKFPGVVLIDEAYADFAEENSMHLAACKSNKNILVMRTFSKSYSLAGLRVGYIVGPKDLIEALFKIKDSYNVDAIAQAIAVAAVKDQKWMRANAKKIIATRRWFTDELVKLGWDVCPSQTNFVFAKPPKEQKAKEIFEFLRAHKVFVRFFQKPKINKFLRISIGTDAEMEKTLSLIKKF
jgi:histidinol-phosphate aminotransferase